MRETAFILAGLIACTACTPREGGGGGSTPPVKLAFVTNNASEFWKIAAAGVRKYEGEGRVQVDVKMPPNGTPEEQNQILENLASQGYDAIAVSAVAPNDQVPVLNRVAEKTPLITFDSDAPQSNRLLYIGTNNYEAGRALGGEIVKLLPSGGNMAVFVGTLFGRQRRPALQGHPGRHRRPQHRRGRSPGGRHRSREGALERRGHRQRASRPQPGRGPVVVQRPGHCRGARVARQEGQGAGGGVRRGGGHAARHRRRHDRRAPSFRSRSSSAISPASGCTTSPPRATRRAPPFRRAKVIDTGVEVITKDNVAEFSKQLAALKQ